MATKKEEDRTLITYSRKGDAVFEEKKERTRAHVISHMGVTYHPPEDSSQGA